LFRLPLPGGMEWPAPAVKTAGPLA
jgi:hypothetical protein